MKGKGARRGPVTLTGGHGPPRVTGPSDPKQKKGPSLDAATPPRKNARRINHGGTRVKAYLGAHLSKDREGDAARNLSLQWPCCGETGSVGRTRNT